MGSVYSAQLFAAQDLDGTTDPITIPDTEVWVIRDFICSVGVQLEPPYLYVDMEIVGVFLWHPILSTGPTPNPESTATTGRIVLEGGNEVVFTVGNGPCDLLVCGYKLTN